MTGPLMLMIAWFYIAGHGQDEALIYARTCAAAQAAAEAWARNAGAELQIVSCERAP